MSPALSGYRFPMGFLDRLLGRSEQQRRPLDAQDEQAIERYRYLVRTAPPERIEEAHEEAFAKLSPEQRQEALRELSATVPEDERAGDDDPRSLARMATRAEMREPGTVERAFGGRGGALGGMGGTLLGTFAAAFAGTLVAQSLFGEFGDPGAEAEGDAGGQDAGGDFSGGDFGGGDFGGGDFGGF